MLPIRIIVQRNGMRRPAKVDVCAYNNLDINSSANDKLGLLFVVSRRPTLVSLSGAALLFTLF